MSTELPTNQNYTDIIIKLNYKRMLFQLPVTLILSLIMAVSVFGNCLVLYVYKSKYKKRASSYFIMVLAFVDLSSSLCIPFTMFDLVNPYMHPVPVLCKINRFVESWSCTSSGLVLVCIAFDRYFHICHPLRIYSINQAQSLTIVMVALAASVSWPILFLAGKRIVPTPVAGVFGEDCSYRDGIYNSIYTLLFQGGLFFTFFVNWCIFSVFYARIFYVIFKRRRTVIGEQVSIMQKQKTEAKSTGKFKCRLHNNPTPLMNNSQDISTPRNENLEMKQTLTSSHQKQNGHDDNVNKDQPVSKPLQHLDEADSKQRPVLAEADSNPLPVLDKIDSKPIPVLDEGASKPLSLLDEIDSKPVLNGNDSKYFLDLNEISLNEPNPKFVPVLSNPGTEPGRTCNVKLSGHFQTRTRRVQRPGTMKMNTVRTTIILAIVTLTSVLGFLPYLTVSLMMNFGKNFKDGMSFADDITYEFCSKSYFLNAAVNPIIYSVMNPVFRHESAAALKRIASIFHRKSFS